MRRLRKLCSVPTLKDFFPNSWDYEFVNIGIQEVNVNDIVGMTSGRAEEYNSDFTPIKEDDRWLYQKQLVDNGGTMEPIPLIKMPDGKYVGNGDGSHRISVAKVLKLQTVQANVSVMVSDELNIEKQWEDHSKDDREKLDKLSEEYKSLSKKCNELARSSYENDDYTEYEQTLEELERLGDEISNLDWKIIEDEKQFKMDLLQKNS